MWFPHVKSFLLSIGQKTFICTVLPSKTLRSPISKGHVNMTKQYRSVLPFLGCDKCKTDFTSQDMAVAMAISSTLIDGTEGVLSGYPDSRWETEMWHASVFSYV